MPEVESYANDWWWSLKLIGLAPYVTGRELGQTKHDMGMEPRCKMGHDDNQRAHPGAR